MNFLYLFNKVLLELNYRPLTRAAVSSGSSANDFERIFKTEHLRVLENLKQVNAEICSSVPWGFLRTPKTDGENPSDETTAPDGEAAKYQNAYAKIYSAQDAQGGLKINLEGPDDRSLIPEAYLDTLVYGATLKTKANPSHPKFSFWNASYARALARMRSECKSSAQDTPYIKIETRKPV